MLWQATNIYLKQSLLANLKYSWSVPTCQMERKIIPELRRVKINHISTESDFFIRSLYPFGSWEMLCFYFLSVLGFLGTWVGRSPHPPLLPCLWPPPFLPFSPPSLPSFFLQIFLKHPLCAGYYIISRDPEKNRVDIVFTLRVLKFKWLNRFFKKFLFYFKFWVSFN